MAKKRKNESFGEDSGKKSFLYDNKEREFISLGDLVQNSISGRVLIELNKLKPKLRGDL